MKVYHASKLDNLCEIGLQTNQPTTCSIYKKCKHIYVGTLDYIYQQYLKYSPKGTYYIYELEIDLNDFEDLPAKGQWRTTKNQFPGMIISTVII